MPVVVAMLRGINLAKHHRIKMEDLRALYESMQLENVRTLVQSGNVVFSTGERDLAKLSSRLEQGFVRRFGFHSDVILRTIPELKAAVGACPFAARRGLEPSKLVVTFLGRDPGDEARAKVRTIEVKPEELHISGREIYIYFPNGQGRSKLPWAGIDRALGTTATARNWNSVSKLLAMAEELQAAPASGAPPSRAAARKKTTAR